MNFPRGPRWAALIVVAIVVAVFAFSSASHRSTVPNDYTLPNDNFDAATVHQIQTDLSQYQVAQTPQDHEVYMVSGGLGVANPRIMGWDSGGNMIFGFNGPPGYTFEIREIGQNPMTWKKVITHGILDPKTKRGVTFTYKPVHWVKHVTKTGATFYKLDDSAQASQYFFKIGDTYILVIPFPGNLFPTGLMNHLVPLGNPVKK